MKKTTYMSVCVFIVLIFIFVFKQSSICCENDIVVKSILVNLFLFVFLIANLLYKKISINFFSYNKYLLLVIFLFLLDVVKSDNNYGFFRNILISLFEELLCRVYMFYIIAAFFLNKKCGLSASVILGCIVSSILFGLFHIVNVSHMNYGYVLNQVLFASVIGVLFSSLFIRTKSLYPSIIIHYCINMFAANVGVNESHVVQSDTYANTLIFIGSVLIVSLLVGLKYDKEYFKYNIESLIKK